LQGPKGRRGPRLAENPDRCPGHPNAPAPKARQKLLDGPPDRPASRLAQRKGRIVFGNLKPGRRSDSRILAGSFQRRRAAQASRHSIIPFGVKLTTQPRKRLNLAPHSKSQPDTKWARRRHHERRLKSTKARSLSLARTFWAAGHTYSTVTEKTDFDRFGCEKSGKAWRFGFRRRSAARHGADCGRVSISPFWRGGRNLGYRYSRRLGVRDRQFRLVDRHRTCGDVSSAPMLLPGCTRTGGRASIAFCRGDDDALRPSPLRGNVSAAGISAGPTNSSGCCPIRTPLWLSGRSFAGPAGFGTSFAVSTYATISLVFWSLA